MKIKYENCVFEIDLKYRKELQRLGYEYCCKLLGRKFVPAASVSRYLFRQNLKKKFGTYLRKPYRTDPYLAFASQLLSTISSPIILDIGANIGTTTIPLAKKFPSASLYAVEPHPDCISKLLRNKTLNNSHQVSIFSTAIGRQSGFNLMNPHPTNDGGHHLLSMKDQAMLHQFAVATVSLKELFLFLELPHCDLLKIDVEGHDVQVLLSLEEFTDPQIVKNIVVEYNPEGLKRAGITGWDLASIGLSRGYKCRILQDDSPISTKKDIPFLQEDHVVDLVFSQF